MGFNLLEQFTPRRLRFGRRSTYVLTPLGRQRVEDESGHGNEWQVMSHLFDNEQCTQQDIQNSLHLSEEQTKRVLRSLMSSQYVKKMQGGA